MSLIKKIKLFIIDLKNNNPQLALIKWNESAALRDWFQGTIKSSLFYRAPQINDFIFYETFSLIISSKNLDLLCAFLKDNKIFDINNSNHIGYGNLTKIIDSLSIHFPVFASDQKGSSSHEKIRDFFNKILAQRLEQNPVAAPVESTLERIVTQFSKEFNKKELAVAEKRWHEDERLPAWFRGSICNTKGRKISREALVDFFYTALDIETSILEEFLRDNKMLDQVIPSLDHKLIFLLLEKCRENFILNYIIGHASISVLYEVYRKINANTGYKLVAGKIIGRLLQNYFYQKIKWLEFKSALTDEKLALRLLKQIPQLRSYFFGEKIEIDGLRFVLSDQEFLENVMLMLANKAWLVIWDFAFSSSRFHGLLKSNEQQSKLWLDQIYLMAPRNLFDAFLSTPFFSPHQLYLLYERERDSLESCLRIDNFKCLESYLVKNRLSPNIALPPEREAFSCGSVLRQDGQRGALVNLGYVVSPFAQSSVIPERSEKSGSESAQGFSQLSGSTSPISSERIKKRKELRERKLLKAGMIFWENLNKEREYLDELGSISKVPRFGTNQDISDRNFFASPQSVQALNNLSSYSNILNFQLNNFVFAPAAPLHPQKFQSVETLGEVFSENHQENNASHYGLRNQQNKEQEAESSQWQPGFFPTDNDVAYFTQEEMAMFTSLSFDEMQDILNGSTKKL